MIDAVETHSFQAETTELMDLMVHSLYTQRDIFLRELISNASDALDRLRFETLQNQDLIVDDVPKEIRIDVDKEKRTLTVSDSGIGMSREEVISNLGTIARSGARELRRRFNGEVDKSSLPEIIGQFGVGFYSAFMVADQVEVLTRRAGESEATLWKSDGRGDFTVTNAEKPTHGTHVRLFLKPTDPEQGIEDFTDEWKITDIVRRYSDFISYPIVAKQTREKWDPNNAGPVNAAAPEWVVEDKVINSTKPLWARTQSEVTSEEYQEFYKHLAHEVDSPLKTIHLRAEGVEEYQALLFIPVRASQDLYYHSSQPLLRLYSNRVMIVERCEDLAPRYLRFLQGVVDSTGLPLNISRQRLQQDRHITNLRHWLTRKVLSVLKSMQENEPAQYLKLWKEFGRALKEGVTSDYENKDKLLALALFQSSRDKEEWITLAQYVERMKPEQKEIFYLTGENRTAIENSPHMEAIKDREIEVLYLTDPVDELLLHHLREFDGKRLKSIGKGAISLDGDDKAGEERLNEQAQLFKPLIDVFEKYLAAHVREVRLSKRLTRSPACLVVADHEDSPYMERLLMRGKGSGPKQRRILELNPESPIVDRIRQRLEENDKDPTIERCAHLLFGLSLLAEGSELADSPAFTQAAIDLLQQAS